MFRNEVEAFSIQKGVEEHGGRCFRMRSGSMSFAGCLHFNDAVQAGFKKSREGCWVTEHSGSGSGLWLGLVHGREDGTESAKSQKICLGFGRWCSSPW